MGKVNATDFLIEKNGELVSGSEPFARTLSPEQRETYEKIFDDFMEQWTQDNLQCFVIGFKTAVRMILESIAG